VFYRSLEWNCPRIFIGEIMSLPIAENTWTFNINNIDYDEASPNNAGMKLYWMLKDTLNSFAVWSVVASSNGTSHSNIGDGGDVDHWDAWSDLVIGDSWVVLENSVTGEQLLIDSDSGSAYVGQIRYSATGSFGTDGAVDAAPSSTEEIMIIDGSIMSATLDSFCVNGIISSDGKSTRLFWLEREGNEYAGNVLIMDEVADTPTEWTSTYKRCVNILTGPTFTNYWSGSSPLLANYIDSGDFYIYWADAVPSEGNYPVSAIRSTVNLSESATQVVPDNYTYTERDGYSFAPISLYLDTYAKGGGVGRLKDIFWAPSVLPTGTTFDSSGSRNWIKWGCFIFPWDGATTPRLAP
jgi:hypothetical protein